MHCASEAVSMETGEGAKRMNGFVIVLFVKQVVLIRNVVERRGGKNNGLAFSGCSAAVHIYGVISAGSAVGLWVRVIVIYCVFKADNRFKFRNVSVLLFVEKRILKSSAAAVIGE